MAHNTQNEYTPNEVSPPGETLAELLEERGMSQAELCLRMGRPAKTISEIVNGKTAITPETALQLELALGVPAEFWNARELEYRQYKARMDENRRFAAEVEWSQKFPIKEMRKVGFIQKHEDSGGLVRELLAFFGIASVTQWQKYYKEQYAFFRQSTAFSIDMYALAAWLRAGELKAKERHCQIYDETVFTDQLTQIRSLTRENSETSFSNLTQACASSGVVLVLISELPGCRVSGATRWLSHYRALIQLSLRYKTDDHFWFSFFHEAAHILKHGKKQLFISSEAPENSYEKEASTFATDFLIPRDKFRRFVSQCTFTRDSINSFADELNIAPGIVVGRLQHEKLITHKQYNELKRPITLFRNSI